MKSRRPSSRSVLALVLALAACGVAESTTEAPDDVDLASAGESITATSCPTATSLELCSGTSAAWSSLLRVAAGAGGSLELAQTFQVQAAGTPSRVRLKLRALRRLPAGQSPLLTAAVRPLVGGAVPAEASTDLARATLALDTVTGPGEFALDFTPTNLSSPAVLAPGTTYALVISAQAPSSGMAQFGLASHQSGTLATGEALIASRKAGAPAVAPAPFRAAPGAGDLSFSLLLSSPGPDPFTVAARSSQPLSTQIVSDPVAISGLATPATASVTGSGAELSIAGGAWSTSGQVSSGQAIRLRLTTSASAGTLTSATLTVGSASATWNVTTAAPGASCRAIFDAGGVSTSGVFQLDPDGAGAGGAFPVLCDMTPGDGGWTLVVGFRGDVLDLSYFDDANVGWKFPGGKGTFLGTSLAYASSYWSPAYGSVAGTRLRISNGTDRLTWAMPSENNLHAFVNGAGKVNYVAGQATGWAFDAALSARQSTTSTNLAVRWNYPLKVRCVDGRAGGTDNAVLGFTADTYEAGYYCEGFGYPEVGSHPFRYNSRWYRETVGTGITLATAAWYSDAMPYAVWVR